MLNPSQEMYTTGALPRAIYEDRGLPSRPLGICRQVASTNLNMSMEGNCSENFEQFGLAHSMHGTSDFSSTSSMSHSDWSATSLDVGFLQETTILQRDNCQPGTQQVESCQFPALFSVADGLPNETYINPTFHIPCSSFSSTSSSSSSSSSSPESNQHGRSNQRKRKRPYVPHNKREAEVVDKRNQRERSRMGNMQSAFKELQKRLPVLQHCSKRIPKERILRVATNYIQALKNVLENPELVQQTSDRSMTSSFLTFLPESRATSGVNGRPVFNASTSESSDCFSGETLDTFTDIGDLLDDSPGAPGSDSDQSQYGDLSTLQPHDFISGYFL